MGIKEACSEIVKITREKSPLVHNMTNYVTVNDCANAVLAIGASPVMADEIDEVRDMVSIASALVINIGTLNRRTIESMLAAGKRANELNIPVIFDPVGAGATPLRTKVSQRIMSEIKLSVIRGNMSEIKCVSGLASSTKGVDAAEDDAAEESGADIAANLAKKLGCTVAITGAVDIISDGERVCRISNGVADMSKITGTGCMTTSMTGGYVGACGKAYEGAVTAIAVMGISGEISLEQSRGTGSLRSGIIDSLSNMTPEIFLSRVKIDEEKY